MADLILPSGGWVTETDSLDGLLVAGVYLTETVAAAFTLTADAGTYALTGTAVALGTGVVPDAGVYALTGADVTMNVATGAFPMVAAGGSYVLSGTDATFTLTGTGLLVAEGATYVLSGHSAWGYYDGAGAIAAAPAAYAISGKPATFTLQADIEEPVDVGEDTDPDSGAPLLTGGVFRLRRV